MSFVPQFQLPDAPGVWMNFDNTVALRHDVGAGEAFETAALAVFALLKDAEARFPGWPRALYLTIDGHLDALGRFDADMVELQQEFLFSVVGPFVAALATPLVSAVNPDRQRNDLPDALSFGPPAAPAPGRAATPDARA